MNLLIDSHCHLDPFIKKNNLIKTINLANKFNIRKFITVGTSPKDWKIYQKLSQTYLSQIYYSIGIHPLYIKDINVVKEINEMQFFIESEHKPIAIGEIGLDFFKISQSLEKKIIIEKQKKIFLTQLNLANKYNLPVIIHCRDAFEECYDLIEKSSFNWNKVIFHCFTYGVNEVKKINKKGGRVSFSNIITFNKSQLIQEAAIEQGLELLILETDSPYISTDPSKLLNIAKFCAKIFNVTLEKLSNITTQNVIKFFNLK